MKYFLSKIMRFCIRNLLYRYCAHAPKFWSFRYAFTWMV